MKKDKLYSDEELELFEALEASVTDGSYKPLDKEELEREKRYYQEIAENTIKKMTKKKSLNLRVYESDIASIKALALEKGMPYQTLLASVIHQVATKQIEI